MDEQVHWYSTKSALALRNYRLVKISQLTIGSAVPIIALLEVPSAITASLGAIVILLEAIQQLFQWQTDQVLYRSTSEALKQQRYLYIAHAGPYQENNRDAVLAEKVQALVSQEHARWTKARQGTDRDLTRLMPPG
ncbi:DUF4231 domain-containing protein [Kribbella sp. NPDC056861]|uniref:DUF4231 domain-containing protein n=1 Tax=Kribbella sp. NPDC056861 TaxID=3154857 RepID=UPI003441CEC5